MASTAIVGSALAWLKGAFAEILETLQGK